MSKKSPKEVHLARQLVTLILKRCCPFCILITIRYIFRIIHGNNQALFHYVNLHFNTGVIICSLDTHSERNLIYRSILNNFKSYAQKIRGVLSQKVGLLSYYFSTLKYVDWKLKNFRKHLILDAITEIAYQLKNLVCCSNAMNLMTENAQPFIGLLGKYKNIRVPISRFLCKYSVCSSTVLDVCSIKIILVKFTSVMKMKRRKI